jgi:hypothetical protein
LNLADSSREVADSSQPLAGVLCLVGFFGERLVLVVPAVEAAVGAVGCRLRCGRLGSVLAAGSSGVQALRAKNGEEKDIL